MRRYCDPFKCHTKSRKTRTDDGNAPDGSHVQDTDDGNAPDGSQDTDDGNAPDGSQDTDDGNAPDGSQDTDDGNAPSSSNSQDDSSESRVLNEVLHLLGASPISKRKIQRHGYSYRQKLKGILDCVSKKLGVNPSPDSESET